MKKQIEVIIKEKDKNQNILQKIEKVSRGYALNYLIPNKIAEIATKGKIKHLKMLESSSYQKANRAHKIIQKISNDMTKVRIIHIRKKCGQHDQIFGSVSEQDIQTKIASITGQELDKKQVAINTIKQIGTYQCNVLINEFTQINIKIRILPSYI